MVDTTKKRTATPEHDVPTVALANLAGGAVVDTPLVLDSKQVRATKSGTPYLTVTLSDSTGGMRGVLFDYDASVDQTEVGSVVAALGKVEVFRGVPRIRLRRLDPTTDYDPTSFVRRAVRPVAAMSEEFGELVGSISDRSAREVVKRIFRSDGLYQSFKLSPLEGSGYGAWVGGAIEHTLRIARLVLSSCDSQPEIDRDMVLAAALVHQVGAVDATTTAPRIQSTVRGSSLPRGVLSAMRVQAGLGAPDCRSAFHNRLERLVLHSTPHLSTLALGGGLAPDSLEYAVLSGAIEMAYTVGSHAEASRAHIAPVVPLRRVG